MKVTREKHFNYMVKLAPAIALAYMLQAWLYLEFVPGAMGREVAALIGVALAGMIFMFMLYDRCHEIILHPQSLEIRVEALNIFDECSFRDIRDVEVKERWFGFSDVLIETHDGRTLRLRHVDDGHEIRKKLLR